MPFIDIVLAWLAAHLTFTRVSHRGAGIAACLGTGFVCGLVAGIAALMPIDTTNDEHLANQIGIAVGNGLAVAVLAVLVFAFKAWRAKNATPGRLY